MTLRAEAEIENRREIPCGDADRAWVEEAGRGVGDRNKDARLAILTQYASPQMAGGLEVFNECLRDVVGQVEIFTNGGPPGEGFGDLGRVGLGEPVAAMQAASALLKRHRQNPFDVILSNGLYGWPLTFANPGVPLIQVYHCTIAGFARRALPLRSERLTRGHVMALFERIAGLGKHVVAVSDHLMQEVESYYGLKGRTIPNGVDTRTFQPFNQTSAREALDLPHRTPIGLFVGRPDYTKGFDILLRVAQLMPSVLFLVAGGPYEGKLRNVRSIGKVPHEKLAQWYSAADFFFLPSRYEGFGLATVEALACDTPVVVSDSAWPFGEKPAECGSVVESDSELDYLAAIRHILAQLGERRFFPRRFILPRYNFDRFLRSWREFIGSLLPEG